MSKHNKVNRDNYTQAGRLTPDEMARERMNQGIQKNRVREQVTEEPRRDAPASTRPRSEREESE